MAERLAEQEEHERRIDASRKAIVQEVGDFSRQAHHLIQENQGISCKIEQIVDELVGKNEALITSRENAVQSLRMLTAEKVQRAAELCQMSEAKDQENLQLLKMQEALAEVQRERDKLTEALNAATEELQVRLAKSGEAECEYQLTRKELEEALEAARETNARHEETIAALEQTIGALENSLESEISERDLHKELRNKDKEEIACKNEEISRCLREVAAMEVQVGAAKKALEEEQQKFSAAQKDAQGLIVELTFDRPFSEVEEKPDEFKESLLADVQVWIPVSGTTFLYE